MLRKKSVNIERQTLSGYPKIEFKCNICGFTGKTSGLVLSCPKCGFNPIKQLSKEREELEEMIKSETTR